jgi:cytochrome c553
LEVLQDLVDDGTILYAGYGLPSERSKHFGRYPAFTVSSALAGDRTLGRVKVENTCQTCHGLDGQATVAMAAHLSGQQKDYLIIQLKAFRDGKRQHPQMSIIAAGLSDEDIENVAERHSGIRVNVEIPE